jgi:sulfate/thiosulfate transport system substrate-binding protein
MTHSIIRRTAASRGLRTVRPSTARIVTTFVLTVALLLCSGVAAHAQLKLLNVSYDPTRELYEDYNAAFAKFWKEKTGQDITIEQSHGGSGSQARAVIDGLPADVVTLALAYDVDEVAKRSGRIPEDWQKLLPHNSSPYTSTMVFLVRKGNPKNIKDWGDVLKPGIQVITPNPKTSGAARWNFLAVWAWALKQQLGALDNITDPSKAAALEKAEVAARAAVAQLYKNVPVLDAGARGSTNTFVQRGLGDVLLAWENEAFLAMNEIGEDQVEIVWPPSSILAEPPVAVVATNASKHDALEPAKAYLEHLYSPEGQKIVARNYYRPIKPEDADPKDVARFPKIELFTVDEVFGGWDAAQAKFFNDGGVFDEIYVPSAPK